MVAGRREFPPSQQPGPLGLGDDVTAYRQMVTSDRHRCQASAKVEWGALR
jgi:hypothetical protein